MYVVALDHIDKHRTFLGSSIRKMHLWWPFGSSGIVVLEGGSAARDRASHH